jgi:hypothetical protein
MQELEEKLGRPRGVPAALAARTGVKASLISMLVNDALHSDTGKRRQIGAETARRLEAGMGKEPNWLDVDRSDARDHKEAAALDRWRKLSDSRREAIIRMMDEFAGTAAHGSQQPPATL